MKMKTSQIIVCCLILGLSCLYIEAADTTYDLFSPDKRTQITIKVGDTITYAVRHDSRELISPSPISLTINGNMVFGKNPEVKNTNRKAVNDTLIPVIKQKSRTILDHFHELTLEFRQPFSLIFRAYDDGIAYRFATGIKGEIKVTAEEASFGFPEDHSVYFPEEESFLTHSERAYLYIPLSQITPERMSSLPALVDVKGGPKIAITEADLEDYPGMYITGREDSPLKMVGNFPHFALEDIARSDRKVEVTKRAEYIAETSGSRLFPWRVLVIADQDGDLVESQMVYKLAKPLQLKDPSWIKPGKVAWDWWNDNNVYHVDFRAGINTQTYKFYIDFAAQNGLEYIILDEGWYKLGNLLDLNPDIDMEELTTYAHSKNVGIILWVIWKTLDDQLEEALDQFEKWGVKGLKVDFMQRDDQFMVNYYHKIAREAARRHMLVDFHGSYKPTGLRRAYPNVLTREGLRGLEWNKWSDGASPDNAVIIPFIRMLAGPMDYTPGAMLNAVKKNFKPVHARPMSQGTRCQQLAMYVVYESPLQMLADSPSNYLREKECLDFLSRVPTVWDETKVLTAEVAKYILIARKSGEEWYLGAMTNWEARELTVDFSFLKGETFTLESYQDGINADRSGIDYKKITRRISPREKLKIKLAPGGGWAARISPANF